MTLISLQNIRMAFGGPMLLDGLSLDVLKGQRICILGRNGAGKSTLLKIMNRELIPDAGDVIYAPSLHVAHLAQNVPETKDGTTFDVVAAGAGPAGVALAAYYHELALGTNPDKLHDAQHDCTTLEGWKLESIVNRVLTQVQVPGDVPFASLSGGMRRRVFLARALVQEPDILLLDEPTNHLDLESIAWLESFLIASRLTVVFVTHDRRFLRRLATRIVEIDRGSVVDWSCDYPTFLERKQAALEVEAKEWAQFDKKLAQEEVWIRQGVRARRTRNEGRVRALKKMREERRRRRERVGNVSMSVNLSERSGDRVLEAEHVTFGYGATPLLNDFSFTLNRGDRVGILGPNGCGKTTLLNLLLGKLTPQHGVVELGSNLSPLYFDQLREGIDLEKTVWENVAPPGGDTVVINGVSRHVISYLLDFLFTADRARTPVKALSGGERHRLLLARLFTFPANLLIFDEPTNDLDAETMELLEELLLDYPGTLIVVSHDREFLNNVVTSALIFDKNLQVNEFVGGYDDWERQLAALAPAATEPPKPKTPVQSDKPGTPTPAGGVRKLSFKEKRELETLPGLIETLDAEQEELHVQLADFVQCQKPGFVAQGTARLAAIEKELAQAYARWETLDALAKNAE